MRWRSYLIIVVFGLIPHGFSAPATGAQPIPPSLPETVDGAGLAALSDQIDAFARDMERLRRFMGVSETRALDIGIRDPLPRDLYFQTLTLWENTDRLSFEVKRVHGLPPAPPSDGTGIPNILARLRSAHQLLRQAMQDLQMAPSRETPAGTPKSFTELFNGVLAINRQLNLMLERHISPSEVYRELTLAIGYSARLLARYPDATRIPPEPPFEPDKQPKDVYLRLIECLQSIARIFDSQGLAVLKIDPGRTDLDGLQPSDVYLVASMIVSQLNFLHQHLDIAKPPPQPVYPGLKFPAHSYQRAGILQAQLRQLERFLATDRATSTRPARLRERETP